MILFPRIGATTAASKDGTILSLPFILSNYSKIEKIILIN